MRWLPRLLCFAATLAAPATVATPALGQAGVEDALLIVDPANLEAVQVAHYYAEARGLHPSRILWLDPVAADYAEQVDVQLAGFLGHLEQRGLDEQIDAVILPPLDESVVPAAGFVSDGCSPVNRFSVAAAFTLAPVADTILAGTTSSSVNHFGTTGYVARAFDAQETWRFGIQSSLQGAERYYLASTLGWTGTHGTDLGDILAMIDRSVAADGSHPAGTVYYMETTDPLRSGPRDGFYPGAVQQLAAGGGQGMHLFADLPLGQHDALGIMTGRANLDIAGADLTLLPGSFADHLTSYAGTFWNNSQTKMTRWIEKGASGTAGTIEEPCNYAGKFNRAGLHVVYRAGLSLGEAWLRTLSFKPFQNLFLGDPLTRPYALPPSISLPSLPSGAWSGTVTVAPLASATANGAAIELVELYVDGVLWERAPAGSAFLLDTTALAEGAHVLTARALDDTPVRHAGRVEVPFEVDHHPESLTLGTVPQPGELSTRYAFDWSAGGQLPPVEVRLLAGGRVVASDREASGTLEVYGWNLGPGPVRCWLECEWNGGKRGRSAEVVVPVTATSVAASGAVPVAHGYTRVVTAAAPFVLELPGVFDDDPALATFDIVQAPAQANRLSASDAGWQVFEPHLGASGTDSVTFTVTTPAGTSPPATIELVYSYADGPPPLRYCVGAPNSAGPGARIELSGSTSIAAGDLVLSASGLPGLQNGLFFQGLGPTQLPLADGFLCIATSHARYGAVQSGPSGVASFPLDYSSPPLAAAQIASGSTWNFQFWYRDPAGGGKGSNTTDALQLTFCP